MYFIEVLFVSRCFSSSPSTSLPFSSCFFIFSRVSSETVTKKISRFVYDLVNFLALGAMLAERATFLDAIKNESIAE